MTPVPDLGTILSVWAHPDDESYGCAGLMAVAVRAGHRVVCVTATRGEQGSTDPERWPPGAPLAEVRTKELEACLAEIGVTEHIWLDYPDGGCADVDPAEPVARIRAVAEQLQPDTVLTFGPDGGTYHPDHMAISRWTTAAVADLPARLHYSSTTPDWIENISQFVDPAMVMMADKEPLVHCIDQLSIHAVLDGELLEMKERAMLCQLSQVEPLIALTGPEMYRRMLAEESFRDARHEGRQG
ncbi:MAG: mycothiol S-conjugate amidase [Pseudonocardiales bacterium]|jgi:LmbE family N-acetylglucosaminyl deacetylase|nr:mycothiol S-conjugate amidase [Pseudonocardiales bacterium]